MSFSIATDSAIIQQPTILGKRRPLLTPLENSPGEFLMVIDNSSLEKFTTCPRSSEFYLVHNREAHAKNSALVFGGALHVGLESFERDEPIEVQNQKITQYMLDHPTPIGDYRTIAVALQVMAHYRVRVALHPDMQWVGLADADGKQIIEKAFELPLAVVDVSAPIAMPWLTAEEQEPLEKDFYGRPTVERIHIAWSGRIDRVVSATGKNRVADHKTTSMGPATVVDEFHLSNPMLGYTWAGRKLWPDLDLGGAVMNWLYLKRPSAAGWPNPANLTAKGPRGGDAPLDFFRAYFDYSPERLVWWEHNVIEICSDFISNLVRGYFPSHTKACISKYGKCPYWGVCTVDNLQTQMDMLKSPMFAEVTWNPVQDR